MPKIKIPVFYKMPDGSFIKKERTFHDTFIQNKKTGKMMGRKTVKGRGDSTGVRRVQKDFILVKKSKTARGHIRTIRKRINKGEIVGKTPKFKR